MKKDNSRVTLYHCFKTSLRANLSYGIKFDLHENEPEDGSHFHVNAAKRELGNGQRFLHVSRGW